MKLSYVRFLKLRYLIFCLASISLPLLISCRQEIVDPVYIEGTRENKCMAMANSASIDKYGVPAGVSVHSVNDLASVWVGTNKFNFSSGQGFSLKNKYLANPYKAEGAKYIEGIWAGNSFSIAELAQYYPDTFSVAGRSSVLYVDVSCAPGDKAGNLNRVRTQGKVGSVDLALGIINYTYRNGVDSIPLDSSLVNPDGSPILVNCTDGDNACRGAFTLPPNVLVKYSYPLQQRPNWLKIQKFLADALKRAKE